MPGRTEMAIHADLQNLTIGIQIDTMLTGDTGVTGTKRLIRSDMLLQSEKIKRGSILQHHHVREFAISEKAVDAHLQTFQEDPSSKSVEFYKKSTKQPSITT